MAKKESEGLRAGADQARRERAVRNNETPGAEVIAPPIRQGSGRGWDIHQLEAGGVEKVWGCGCRIDKDGNFYECKTNYCYLDPAAG